MADFLSPKIDRQKETQKIKNNDKKDITEYPLETLEDLDNREPLEFIKSNTIFDLMIGGFEKRSFTVIAAQPGHGKSLMCLSLALEISAKFRILYVSYENDGRIDYERAERLKTDYYNSAKLDNISYVDVNDIETSENIDFQLKDVEALIATGRYDFIFLDGIQNAVDTDDEGGSMFADGNNIAKRIIQAAKAFKRPVIATWQLGRIKVKNIEDIEMSDISFSMGLVRYPTSVIALLQENKKFNFKVLKNRFGYSSMPITKNRDSLNLIDIDTLLTQSQK